MNDDRPIARCQVQITNALGLHFRPARKFAELAEKYQAEVFVHLRGHALNGKSMLDLLTQYAEKGTQLDLEARGPDADDALAALADLIRREFDEDDNGRPKPPNNNNTNTNANTNATALPSDGIPSLPPAPEPNNSRAKSAEPEPESEPAPRPEPDTPNPNTNPNLDDPSTRP